jgi:hypothetical protein
MATVTLTGKTAGEIARIGLAMAALADTYVDNRAVGTFTVTDASPSVITSVDSAGTTRTVSV